MRILHVYKDYWPVIGGIENHVRLLAERQARRGHEVTVLVTARGWRGGVERRNGVRIIRAGRLATMGTQAVSQLQPAPAVSASESGLIHWLTRLTVARRGGLYRSSTHLGGK